MIRALARKFLGFNNRRRIAGYQACVAAINALESDMTGLSDHALRSQTNFFRDEIRRGKALDEVLAPAFAVVREAARRALGYRHFDEQLIGGTALHNGAIAEMKTGEGKTLTATLPAYLNALAGRGVHIVTANDYLARRDAQWMEKIYRLLGLTVGVVTSDLDQHSRRAAYGCDITYGTGTEFGFDYLRDNMQYRAEDLVQRGHAFAIVDEADSILIDEARTPLVISEPSGDRSSLYSLFDRLARQLGDEDFEIDHKLRTVVLTSNGIEKTERNLRAAHLLESASLFDLENVALLHHINQALKAHQLLRRDNDYIVHDGEIVIIDETSGRALPGRRHAAGLHQAIEAKENLTIRPESRTLASITVQNYYRTYEKLAGMSGTALSEASEFRATYDVEVVAVPTHLPTVRDDASDEIYRTETEKLRAICAIAEDCQQRGQPLLIGTTSIEKSEQLAKLLRVQGWEQCGLDDPDPFGAFRDNKAPRKKVFALLNARYHAQEARIVSQAGIPGAVTIATNMAGRGIDIELGGSAENLIRHALPSAAGETREKQAAEIRLQTARLKQQARGAGGLFVLGTERHDSRRLDDQLRGRAGRQGDPGRTKFLLSLEDPLLQSFAAGPLERLLAKHQDGAALSHRMIDKAVEKAQKMNDARHLNARQTLLKFDDVLDEQRKVIFQRRREIMEEDQIADIVSDMRHACIEDIVNACLGVPGDEANRDWPLLDEEVRGVLTLAVPTPEWMVDPAITPAYVRDYIATLADSWIDAKVRRWGDARLLVAKRRILLALLDDLWLRHVADIEILRHAAPLRTHGRRDPLVEFKLEAFGLFEQMLQRLRRNVTAATMRVGFEGEVSQQPAGEDVEHEVVVPHHLTSVMH